MFHIIELYSYIWNQYTLFSSKRGENRGVDQHPNSAPVAAGQLNW